MEVTFNYGTHLQLRNSPSATEVTHLTEVTSITEVKHLTKISLNYGNRLPVLMAYRS